MSDTHRRQFLVASGALLLAPVALCQDARRVYRLGFLSASDAGAFKPALDAFRDALRGLGWVEGRSVVIEVRYAEGDQRRLREQARELARQRVDIFLAGTTFGTLAAREANPSAPVVMAGTLDAQLSGLVDDLARPGGNVTGLTLISPAVVGKRLSLIKEAIPGVARLGVLSPKAAATPQVEKAVDSVKQAMREAALRLGMELHTVAAFTAEDVEAAFAQFEAAKVQAVYGLEGSLAAHRFAIARHAFNARLPTMFGLPTFVEAGGLMSYGPDILDLHRRAASYVDKILRGARPGDLPVEQPTRYELVVNVKTAQALGLSIPPAVMLRVDRRVE